ncbi:MAG TPA: hypothetical protein VG267_02645 [Terracidiphilus sp.]|jgi:hypothetical protein|nr:hypothetical protein [Terracidiphilus sp.]
MTTDVMVEGNRVWTARMRARIAGALYVLSVATAIMGEFVIPGRMGLADVVIPVGCYAAAMLLLFGIFAPVNRRASIGVLVFGLACLGLQAARWHPGGMNVAMVAHAFYCLLLGSLMLRARFLPRWLGAAMMLAVVIGEALPMLWLLTLGVNERRWMEQAEAGGRR